jgi:UrcA family protein
MKSSKRTTTMASTIKTLILATAAVTAFAGPALAGQTPDDLTTFAVNTKGYDLSSPKGVASVTRKAHRAAMEMCGVGKHNDLGLSVAANRCFKSTVADIARQIETLRQIRMAGRTGEQVAVADTNVLPVTK